ncbi:SDR family NAD(P)-dependent oxidoreductase [Streptomyces sp. JJ36]|uniref:SDR family NAD(P)-dependent oxidoreductase n=1 Tax=Streptomyces sp. JJ36 TaxID=2736645 RepID=UPI001F338ACF|nr:SDR family NAD(P)-dependent oxidoreductase [Streptomyces sp. JJ36]MCF6524504.1 SDR family NAD(P)-dependent oxidoreductase [Streptomyces sp. JJ36]
MNANTETLRRLILERVRSGRLDTAVAARLLAARNGTAADRACTLVGYEPVWEEAGGPGSPAGTALPAGEVLLVEDGTAGPAERGDGPGDGLSGPRDAGPGDVPLRHVRVGRDVGGDTAAWTALLDELRTAGRLPRGLVFALPAGRITPERAVELVLPALQAVIAARDPGPLPVAFLVTGADGAGLGAALGAFAQVVADEDRRLAAVSVRVDDRWPGPGTPFARALAELGGARPGLAEVRYGAEGRRVRVLRRCGAGDTTGPAGTATGADTAPDGAGDAPEGDAVFRPGGRYLLTGGGKGIGRRLAAVLAREYRARLVLTGRSAPDAELVAELRRLEEAGARVRYVRGDVTRYADVAEAVATAEQDYGGLDGVLHCAGLNEDAYVVNKDPASARRVLAVKLTGAAHLDRATAGRRLDFLALFSSTSAWSGAAGQADYAAANRGLGALAAARAERVAEGTRHGASVSVAWPLWAEGGMEIAPETRQVLEEMQGMVAMPTPVGFRALRGAIAAGRPETVVVYGREARIERWVSGLSATAAPAPGTGHPAPDAAPAHGPASAGEPAEGPGGPSGEGLTAAAQEWLLDLVRRTARLPAGRLRADQEFATFGIDSILIKKLTAALEDRLGELPVTLFFENRTVGELAGYLAAHRPAELRAALPAPGPAPDGAGPPPSPGTGDAAEDATAPHGAVPGGPARAADASRGPDTGDTTGVPASGDGDRRPAGAPVADSGRRGQAAGLPSGAGTGDQAAAGDGGADTAGSAAADPAPAAAGSGPAAAPDVGTAAARDTAPGTPGGPEGTGEDLGDAVAIVGLGCRYPGGADLAEFWDSLSTGADLIREIPADRWDNSRYRAAERGAPGAVTAGWGGFLDDVARFDPLFFSIAPSEAPRLDPNERIFLEVAWSALEHAGYSRQLLHERTRTAEGTHSVGVYVGVTGSQYGLVGAEQWGRGNRVFAHSMDYSLANRLSYVLDVHGPSMVLDTACSGSLTALHLACRGLLSGETRMALAGGVNVNLHPLKYATLTDMRLLASDGRCRAFGAGGDGFVPGEGAGALVLKRLADALADGDRVHAVIRGTAINHGGRSNGYTVPTPRAQGAVVAEALRRGRVDPRSVSYVEAHGTGTALGDPVELEGLTRAFRAGTEDRGFCAIGSVKSNIGHLEAAAGVCGVTKVVLQFAHRTLVPTLHSEPVNPKLHLESTPFRPQRTTEPWESPEGVPRRAAVSSFGAGGANGHVVLEEWHEPEPDRASAAPDTRERAYPVCVSARTPEQLRKVAERLAAALERRDGSPALRDVAWTLLAGRDAWDHRLAVAASSVDELCRALRAHLGGADGTGVHTGRAGAAEPPGTPGGADAGAWAAAWAAGASLDPAEVFGDGPRPRPVPLPAYPFGGRRYWVPLAAEDAAPGAGRPEPAGASRTEDSRPEPAPHSAVLRRTDAVLADHRVRDRAVVAGVVQLALVRAALAPDAPDAPVVLEGVRWRVPLEAHDDALETEVTLTEGAEPGGVEYAVRERSTGTVHSTGTAHPGAPEETPEPLDVAALRDRCPRAVPGDAVYAAAEAAGLRYGPLFRGLRTLRRGDGEALAELERPETGAPEWAVEAAMTDSALHAVQGVLPEGGTGTALPASVERIAVHGPARAARHAHVALRALDSARGTARADVTLAAEDGRVLVRFENLRIARPAGARPGAAPGAGTDTAGTADTAARPATATVPDAATVPDVTADATADATAGRAPGGDGPVPLHRAVWRPEPPAGPADDDGRPVLVLTTAHDHGLGAALAARHRAAGSAVRVTHLADVPRGAQGFAAELAAAGDPGTVWYLGGVEDRRYSADDLDQLDDALDDGPVGLFHLLKALDGAGGTRSGEARGPARLHVVTSGVQQTDEAVAACHPFGGGLPGLVAAASRERGRPGLSCVDVARDDLVRAAATGLWEPLLDLLTAEPAARPAHPAAIADGVRYARHLERVFLPAPAGDGDATAGDGARPAPVFRQGGRYLIAGGAGGLGAVVAGHLARRYDARVLLLGRRAPERLPERVAALPAEFPGQVRYLAADVADETALRDAVHAVRREWGGLDGVFQSAFVLDDRTLSRMDEETLRASFAPKARGTVLLHRVLADEPLDFFALFSSAISHNGNAGQANYAAASTLQDAYGRFLAARLHRPVRVLNWGLWGESGSVATEDYRAQVTRRLGVAPLSDADGLDALHRVLAGPLVQVAPVRLAGPDAADTTEPVRPLPERPADEGAAVAAAARAAHARTAEGATALPGRDFFGALEPYARLLLRDALLAHGGWPQPGTRVARDELAARLGVLPAQRRLLDAALFALERGGHLTSGPDGALSVPQGEPAVPDPAAAEALRARLVAEHPHAGSLTELLRACTEALPEVLCGRRTGLSVLFPGGSDHRLAPLYHDDPRSGHFNAVCAAAVSAYAGRRLADGAGHLDLLEIGAGTGGTSRPVLEALRPLGDRFDYAFTDLSPGLVRKARQRFGDEHPRAGFSVLDIAGDPAAQGFTEGSYDVVLAANVLHATPDVSRTVRAAARMLRPGGLLLVNEGTRVLDAVTVIFGLTEGWWAYDDAALRQPHSPLLTPGGWRAVLLGSGLRGVRAVGAPGADDAAAGQHVVLAERDGWPVPAGTVPVGAECATAVPTADAAGPAPAAVPAGDAGDGTGDGAHGSGAAERRSRLATLATGYLTGVFCDVLKLDRDELDPDAPLASYGTDSLVGMEAMDRIEADLGPVPRTVPFESTSVTGVVEALLDSAAEPLARLLGDAPATTPARGPRADAGTTAAPEHAPAGAAPDAGTPALPPPAGASSEAAVRTAGTGAVPVPGAGAAEPSPAGSRPAVPAAPAGDVSRNTVAAPAAAPPPAAATGAGAQTAPGAGAAGAVSGPAGAAPDALAGGTAAAPGAAGSSGNDEPVAITGLSGRFPGAGTVDALWDHLRAGRRAVTEIPPERWDPSGTAREGRWGAFLPDVEAFDPLLFRMSPREAERTDPQERLVLEAVWTALEDAGLTRRALEESSHRAARSGVGVFVGLMHSPYQVLAAELRASGSDAQAYSAHWSAANRVSYTFGFTGPSLAVDTACSSALTALHLAAESIRRGECGAAVVSGVNLLLEPSHHAALAAGRMLSPDGRSRAFAQDAAGMVPGEGVGAVVLRPLSEALRDGDRVHGVILGSAVNANGATESMVTPSTDAQERLLRRALERAGVEPGAVQYVEAQATGSALADPVEAAALARVFGAAGGPGCRVGSVKPALGHLEAASGMAQLAKVLLQLRHGELAPTLDCAQPLEPFDGRRLALVRDAAPWPGGDLPPARRVAALSSFGAGGANAHVVVGGPPEAAGGGRRERPRLVLLSARRPQQLREHATRLRDHLARLGDEAPHLADVARTLAAGREPLAERLALVAGDVPELVRLLDGHLGSAGSTPGPGAPVHTGRASGTAEDVPAVALAPDADPSALSEAAAAWVRGAELHGDGGPLGLGDGRVVSLPGYPFARTVHRLPSVTPPADAPAGTEAGGRRSHPAVTTGPPVRATAEPGGNGPAEAPVDGPVGAGTAPPGPPGPASSGTEPPAPGGTPVSGHPVPPAAAEPRPPAPDPHPQPSERRENDVSQTIGPPTPEARERIRATVVDAVAGVLHVQPEDIGLDEHLSDFGFDSVTVIELADRIRAALGTELNPAEMYGFRNVAALVEALARQKGATAETPAPPAAAPAAAERQPAPEPATPAAPSGTAPDAGAAAAPTEPAAPEPAPVPAPGPAPGPPGHTAGEPVAVVGMAGAFPGSPDLETYWSHLVSGRELTGEIPAERFDWREIHGDPKSDPDRVPSRWGGFLEGVDLFDPEFFRISPREARLMDPQHRLFLETVWHAVEDAGHDPTALAGTDTGVFVGCGSTEYATLLLESGVEIDGQLATGNAHSILANRVSYLLDLRGPSEPVDTACSSSLVAVHRAVRALQDGECSAALAGGVNLTLTPTGYLAFGKSGMLAADGRCKAFDHRADGYVRGEGVGAVLLKPLSAALRDGDTVHALIRGSALNHGGRAASLTAPNSASQAAVVAAAHRRGGTRAEHVGYVEAHGTGTALGDPVEINGLREAFRDLGVPEDRRQYAGIGSVKSNVGHLETAAGIAGMLKVILAMRHRMLPPTLHVERPNPLLELADSPFHLVDTARPWDRPVAGDGRELPRLAGVSSFGFGGVNAHVVLEEYVEPQPAAAPAGGPELFVLSARTDAALAEYARRLAGHLDRTARSGGATAPPPDGLAHTLRTGRPARERRLAVVAGSTAGLAAALRAFADGEPAPAGLHTTPETADRAAAGLLDEDDRARVLQLAREGDLHKVAALWVRGADVDWHELYRDGGSTAPRRVTGLPGYPFARERHWLPAPATTAARTAPPGRPGARVTPTAQAPAAPLPAPAPQAPAPHGSPGTAPSPSSTTTASRTAPPVPARTAPAPVTSRTAPPVPRPQAPAAPAAVARTAPAPEPAAAGAGNTGGARTAGGDTADPDRAEAPASATGSPGTANTPGTGNSSGADATPAGDDLADQVRFLVAEGIGLAPGSVDPDRDLASYGVDSISALRIMQRLQARFGDHIPMAAIFECTTLTSLVQHLVDEYGISDAAPGTASGAGSAAGAPEPEPAPAAAQVPAPAAGPTATGRTAGSDTADAPSPRTAPSAGTAPEPVAARAVPFGPEGPGTPVHALPGTTGELTWLLHLRRCLDGDGPVRGVEFTGAPPRDPDGAPDLAVLAAACADAVTADRPAGPYRIAGHAAACRLAVETARLLTDRGEEVTELVLFDAPDPAGPATPGVPDPVAAVRAVAGLFAAVWSTTGPDWSAVERMPAGEGDAALSAAARVLAELPGAPLQGAGLTDRLASAAGWHRVLTRAAAAAAAPRPLALAGRCSVLAEEEAAAWDRVVVPPPVVMPPVSAPGGTVSRAGAAELAARTPAGRRTAAPEAAGGARAPLAIADRGVHSVPADDRHFLVPVNRRGDHVPSFWVHHLFGDVSYCIYLSRYLGMDHPVYALEQLDADLRFTEFASVEEMAARYVAELREEHPHGPYVLGGASFGGILAFEMARQLTEAGEEVSHLYLVDALLPGTSAWNGVDNTVITEENQDAVTLMLIGNSASQLWKAEPSLTIEELSGMPPEEAIDHITRHIVEGSPAELSADEVHRLVRTRFALLDLNGKLLLDYETKPFARPVPTTVFQATKGFSAADNPYGMPAITRDDSDATNGLGDHAGDDVTVHLLDADHFTIVLEENLRVIADVVQRTLPAHVPNGERS